MDVIKRLTQLAVGIQKRVCTKRTELIIDTQMFTELLLQFFRYNSSVIYMLYIIFAANDNKSTIKNQELYICLVKLLQDIVQTLAGKPFF